MAEKITRSLSKGLLRNKNKLKQDPEFYTHALNLTVTESLADRVTKVTEKKPEHLMSLSTNEYKILGVVWINDDEYVYFIKELVSGKNKILHVNKDIITLKYDNDGLNFQFNKLISTTYRVDFKGNRIIYFVDGFNNDRVINIDTVSLTDVIESIDLISYYGSSNDISISVTDGGKLLQGNYIVAVSFNDINNLESNIKIISNSLSIGDGNYQQNRKIEYTNDDEYFKNKSSSFIEVKGLDNDVQTNKAIKLNIEGDLNENYQSMNVYLVRFTQETTEVKVLENIRVNTSLIITGSESFRNLGDNLSLVIASNILYNKSEVISQKDNRLLRANTKIESSTYNFQTIANAAEITYVIDSDLATKNTTDDKDNKKRGNEKLVNDFSTTINLYSSSPDYLANSTNKLNKTFSRDEVYSLGVYFELNNGVVTDVYHIPGRLPNIQIAGTTELTGTPNNYSPTSADFDTGVASIDGVSNPRWKHFNTAIKISSTEGKLGYYRCNEVYPDGYGFPTNGEKDPSGKSYIRHHKIPSDILEPIITTSTARLGTTSNVSVLRNNIGLRINLNVPDEVKDIIKKAYYVYVPKTDNNKFCLGKGISYAINGAQSRQSDQLNRYATTTNLIDKYEFYSAESLFKFKQSNISAKRIKSTALVNGVVRYMSRTLNEYYRNQTTFDHYPTWINSEGAIMTGSGVKQQIESYNYKQQVRFDTVFYNRRLNLGNEDKKVFNIDDIRFVNGNSYINMSSENIDLSGSQNQVIIKLKGSKKIYYDVNLNFSSLFTKYRLPWSSQELGILDNVNAYQDTVMFSTLLSDNYNIDFDLINLKYVKSDIKDNLVQGDSFIDVMYGKRGFGDIFNSDDNSSSGMISNKEYIITFPGFPKFPLTQSSTDTLQYEDYFAFFTESQINVRMRTNRDVETDYFPNFTLNTKYITNEFEKKAGVQEIYHMDEGYNIKHLDDKFANNVKVSDIESENRRLETRIVYSEVQNNESKTDSYRRTLANNYRDLLTTRGPIYVLFNKQERLYAITRDSIFMISTSSQTLKTDSEYNITVGTGDFFGIEPIELTSIEGGIGGTSSKLSFNENQYGYVFADRHKGSLYLFNDSLVDINSAGLYEDFKINLQEYIPDLFTDGTDNPQLGYGISVGYDNKLKRILVTKKDYKPLKSFLDNYKGAYTAGVNYTSTDYYSRNGLLYNGSNDIINLDNKNLFENKSFTASYDLINQSWLSYHSYIPYRYIYDFHDIKLIDNSGINVFKNNYSDIQVLEVLFNDYPNTIKVFDSIQIDLRSEDINGNSTDDFFNQFIAYNEKQSTGLVNLNKDNLTKKETNWNINNLRDDSIDYNIKQLFSSDWEDIKDNYYTDKVVKESSMDNSKVWYKKGRLRDKYIIVRFIRNNLDNKKIFCNFVSMNIRSSIR